jgi:phosphatidylserine/phosphatidylglycerophosphate/cardiolipin synthase-like enzyme
VELVSSSAVVVPTAVQLTGASFGSVLAVLDAVSSHETAVQIITKAAPGERVTMLGFSFDRAEIVSALVGARKRGCLVRVVLDHNMTIKGKTRDQFSSAKELVACGVLLRVTTGVPLGPEYQAVGRSVPGFLNGIQHSKAVLAGREAVIGSANWTTSTRSNFELGLHVEFNASHADIVEEMFLGSWHAGKEFALASASATQHARSCSPGGRGFRRW